MSSLTGANKSIGVGQVVVLPVRVAETIYRNSTGRPIVVEIIGSPSYAQSIEIEMVSPFSVVMSNQIQPEGQRVASIAVIPPDAEYRYNVSIGTYLVRELR